MEAVLLLLLITVAGSSGFGIFDHCDVSRCSTFSPEEFRSIMRNFPPSETELKATCPPFLETIDCFSDLVVECTGESLEELAGSKNASVAQFTTMINNVMGLIRDVCDEDSQFRKDFADSSTCLKKRMFDASTDCRQKGNSLYDMFKFPEGFEEEEEGEEEEEDDEIFRARIQKLVAEAHCLTQGFEVACMLKDVEKTCGEVAKNVLLEVVRRPQMLKMGICSEEDLLTLRGQFLDFLEEQGEQREFLSSVFEFRRRRK